MATAMPPAWRATRTCCEPPSWTRETILLLPRSMSCRRCGVMPATRRAAALLGERLRLSHGRSEMFRQVLLLIPLLAVTMAQAPCASAGRAARAAGPTKAVQALLDG